MNSVFDDDDCRGNFVNVNHFEDDDDDDVLDNWEDELDEEEEAEKKRKEKEDEEERKRLEKERKLQKRIEEKAKQEELHRLLNAKPLSKEEQERAQLQASQKQASDLFGFEDDVPSAAAPSSSIQPIVTKITSLAVNPDSVDSYVPVDPEDFGELARRLLAKLRPYQDDDGYKEFIRDLVPELCSEMVSDDIKKVSNPLSNLSHEKARLEREAKKKAQQSSKKKTVNIQKKVDDNRSDFLLDEYRYQEADQFDHNDDFDFM